MMMGLQIYAQVIHLFDISQKTEVAYPYYLEDEDAKLDFGDIINKKYDFVQSEKRTPDFMGNFSEAVWYRFDVHNNSSTEYWYLEIKAAFMHDITVYQMKEDGSVQSLKLNGSHRFRSKPITSNNLIFPLIIPKNTTDKIYVRATSKTLIRTSMSISTMPTLYENAICTSYGDGFFTAVAFALLLYNLFVYFKLRERIYLYYIGYISAAILHNNIVAGHLQFFFPLPDWINTTTVLPLMSFFTILFTNTFLQTRQYAPLIYKIRVPLMLICLFPLICYAFSWYRLGVLLAGIHIFTLCIYWIFAGITAYRNGYAPAVFYMAGYGAIVIVSVIYELKMQDVLPENYWTDSSLFIGVAIEAIILSFALANKFNFYKKEKERLQEEAYKQAIHFSRELINMQEAERKRIASELHDSLGQKLVLIKNRILRVDKSDSESPLKKSQDGTLAQNVTEAIQEIRNISYALRPYQLDLLGLTSSIKSMVEESFNTAQIDYEIKTDNIDNLFGSESQINIYRIIQECINNIMKHADAKNVKIIIKHDFDEIKIAITDDGIGFDINDDHTGFGLKGIKERLQILNGSMDISSGNPKGTIFDFLFPLQLKNN